MDDCPVRNSKRKGLDKHGRPLTALVDDAGALIPVKAKKKKKAEPKKQQVRGSWPFGGKYQPAKKKGFWG